MRYHFLSFARTAPLLRWFHLPDRRPWLDVAAPQTRLVVQLFGPDAARADLAIADRDGTLLPLETAAPGPLPPDLPLLRGQPEADRLLVELRFAFPGPRPLSLIDRRDGTVLLRMEPQIVFPAHVFALMEEARQAGFAPRGFDHFIETGTLFGHTTLHASYWVREAVTIELSETLHAEAVRHLAHRPNVTCLQGNSAERLPEVIAARSGPAFYFLDAHFSGDSGTDWQGARFAGYPVDTARLDDAALAEGERQVPLRRELEQVAGGHDGPALILIDDWGGVGLRDFAFRGEDWSHLDPAALLGWMRDHPRHAGLFRADPKRMVWMID